MKRYLGVVAAAVSLTMIAVVPASAIDAQPGGIGGAVATVGAPTTDDDDQTIDRCECDGGPLERITVFDQGGGTDVVRIDSLMGATVRTTDGTEIGVIVRVSNNSGDNAIVILVEVRGDALPVARFAVRRTGFYVDGGNVTIDTDAGDLAQSIQAAGAGA